MSEEEKFGGATGVRFSLDPDASERSGEEVCREVIIELLGFKRNARDLVRRLSGALKQGMPYDRVKEHFDRLVSGYKIFSKDYYHTHLFKNELLEAGVRHDLSNIANVLFVSIQFLARPHAIEERMHFLDTAIWAALAYSSVLEDVCLRAVYKDAVPANHQENIDLALLSELTSWKVEVLKYNFLNQMSVIKLRGKSTELSTEFADPKLASDEKITTNTSFLVNAIFNCLSNAIHAKANLSNLREAFPGLSDDDLIETKLASRIKVVGKREGNNYVIQVIDDGQGMEQGKLDATSSQFIFLPGVSGRGGTGYGLGDMQNRAHTMGNEVQAASRLHLGREKFGGSASYPSSEVAGASDALAEEKLESVSIDLGRKAATVFEFYLPITKK